MFSPVMTTRKTMGLRAIRPMVTGRERVALLRRLIAYWKHEEGDSVDRLDATGNDHDLAQTGGVTQEIGKIDFGTGFAAASNQMLSNSDAALRTRSFTDQFWINLTDQDGFRVVAARYDGGDAGNRTWILQQRPTDTRFKFEWFFDGGSDSLSLAIGSAPLTTWLFVVVRSDAAGAIGAANTWYLDVRGGDVDVDFTSGAEAGPATATTIGLSFGDAPSQGQPISMISDEAGHWDRALTEAEVNRLYNNGNGWTLPLTEQPAAPTGFYYY